MSKYSHQQREIFGREARCASRPVCGHQSQPAASSPSRSYLQDLPGEIRNMIYRLAVVDSRSIAVHSKGYNRSGLLATNKEIRREALKIYYMENHFDIAALELDSATLAQWCRMLEALQIPPQRVSMTPYIRQTAHWTNLMKWIRYWHAGVIPARLTYPEHLQNAEVRAVHAMFDIAMTMKGQPWELLKAVLANQRSVLVAMNPRWAMDL